MVIQIINVLSAVDDIIKPWLVLTGRIEDKR